MSAVEETTFTKVGDGNEEYRIEPNYSSLVLLIRAVWRLSRCLERKKVK